MEARTILRHQRFSLISVCIAVSLTACSRLPANGAAAQTRPADAPTSSPAAPAGAAKAGMAMASAHGSSTPAPPQVTDVIAQPAGGTSIKDVWAQRKPLSGKTVTVRGKAVKVNNGILDRNWLHLQDGTGTAADGTNDLTVTTAVEAQVGDVITVTGTLALDRDFTAGYVYPVILENATIVKQR